MSFPRQAMILAAGRGTRLGPLGRSQAKALIEVDGRPMLEHHLRYLGRQGVSEVVVNASHLAEKVEEFAASFVGPPSLVVSVESEPLGTAGGVINVLPDLGPDPLLVLYGDVLLGEDLAAMGELHERRRPVTTLAVYHSDTVREKGVVELSDDRITGFREKDPDATSGWVNAGIYIIEPEWLRSFSDLPPLDFGFDLFPAALAADRDLRAYRLSSPVLDIGTPSDLARAQALGFPDV